MGYPALDLAGYEGRTVVPAEYVAKVEAKTPGFTARQIALTTSRIYSQLRKRYGRTAAGASALPFGQSPAQLVASGTVPPMIQLSGVPTLGSLEIAIRISTPGPFGTALFDWSANAGRSWVQIGEVTAAVFPLGKTGIVANFGAGTYSADNTYLAPPPVDEVILGWIVAIVNRAVLRKHGVNANDPQIKTFIDEAQAAIDEVSEAANGDTGLFELSTSDDGDTAVTTGDVLSYTEAGSPYVSADRQEAAGLLEDQRHFGTETT